MSSGCGPSVALVLAILQTALGVFLCEGITCLGTPDPDYAAFWKPPLLLVTVAAKPFAVLECRVQVFAHGKWTLWTCE